MEIALLDADAVIQVIVAPLATRKADAERQRQGPVVTSVHVHESRVPLAVHLDTSIRQKTLVTQKPFRFQHQVQVHDFALVEQEQLADSGFAGLDMDDIQQVVGPLVVLGMLLGIIKGITDMVTDLVYAERRRGISRGLPRKNRGHQGANK